MAKRHYYGCFASALAALTAQSGCERCAVSSECKAEAGKHTEEFLEGLEDRYTATGKVVRAEYDAEFRKVVKTRARRKSKPLTQENGEEIVAALKKAGVDLSVIRNGDNPLPKTKRWEPIRVFTDILMLHGKMRKVEMLNHLVLRLDVDYEKAEAYMISAINVLSAARVLKLRYELLEIA